MSEHESSAPIEGKAIINETVHNGAEQCTSQTALSAPQAFGPDPDGEKTYSKPKDRVLSAAQMAALPLLAAGLNDSEVARRVGVHRNTVNRWRIFDPLFLSRLNREREAVWQNTLDSLRSLLPLSVAVLARAVRSDNPLHQQRAAIQLLKIAGTSRLAPRVGPTVVQQILRRRFQDDRESMYSEVELTGMSAPNASEIEELYDFLLTHIAQEDARDAAHPDPDGSAS